MANGRSNVRSLFHDLCIDIWCYASDNEIICYKVFQYSSLFFFCTDTSISKIHKLSHNVCITLTNLKCLFEWNQIRINEQSYLFSDFYFQNKRPTAVLNLSDRYVPTLLKSLRTQKVVHICCGEDHTAALTKVQYLKICLCFDFFNVFRRRCYLNRKQ